MNESAAARVRAVRLSIAERSRAARDAPARREAALRDANTDELPIASIGTVTGSNLPREQSRADPGRSHRVFPSDITK
jgi:hypothetical protein